MSDDIYTPEQRRVCEYLQQIMPDIGCGDDPIGFLIASHAALVERNVQAKAPTMMDLLSRVLSALGPDRELDLAIERKFNRSAIHKDYLDRFPENAQRYTESMDAVLRLLDQEFPVAGLTMHRKAREVILHNDGREVTGFGASLPLAVCAVIIQAKMVSEVKA